MSQQVWHVKEPSLLKAMSVKHSSKFAALSLVIVAAAEEMKNCLCSYKQSNKLFGLRMTEVDTCSCFVEMCIWCVKNE
jgi:hypothetical protein